MVKITVGAIVVLGIAVAGFTLMSGKWKATPSGAAGTAARASALPAGTTMGQNSPPAGETNTSAAETGAMAALRKAGEGKKHLLVFVQEKDDEQTRAARKTFDGAIAGLGDAVQSVVINRTTPSESRFIEKYGLKTAPMPIALVFAPNGAIMGGFPGSKLTEQQLLGSLASPVMQACLKALQDKKLVFLCAQNSTTKSNDSAMKGVSDFKADNRFAQFTEIVKVDPSNTAERDFLAHLQIEAKPDEAMTVFIAPPGAVIAKLKGATNKDMLVATLQKASSKCSGASGCCPQK